MQRIVDRFFLNCRDKGYPEEIRSTAWEPEAAIRGLVVDKKLGNLLVAPV